METVAAPEDALAFLAECDALNDLDQQEIGAVAVAARWRRLPGREVLVRQGEVANAVYLVHQGALRVIGERNGISAILAEHRRGDMVGEAGVLAATPRAATLIAIRETVVAEFDGDTFRQLLRAHSGIGLAVAKMLSQRLVAPLPKNAPNRIGVIVALNGVDRGEPWHALVASIAKGADAEVHWVGNGAPPDLTKLDADEHRHFLVTESLHDQIPDETMAMCRQADEIILVADANTRVNREQLRPVEQLVSGMQGPTCRLILQHRSSSTRPTATGRFLGDLPIQSHHHVRIGNARDAQTVGRVFAQTSLSLVFGGGGARGGAHIGVLQAFEECDIVIDHVGGTSMGAIIGGAYCAGYRWDELCGLIHEWRGTGALRDLAFPTVSFLNSKKTEAVFGDMFGSSDIEDLWTNFFCATVDITVGQLALHQTGNAARWIRASGAVPGVFPPVVGPDGHLHVDGGLMNNVPSDVMSHRWHGRVIAVDVGAPSSNMKLSSSKTPALGVRHLIDKRRNRPSFPSVGETLQRGATLSSSQQRELSIKASDVFLEPAVSDFGLFEFARIEEIAKRGYECAMSNMEQIVERIEAIY
jgi:predicted acylesterase/phospholipase RssA